ARARADAASGTATTPGPAPRARSRRGCTGRRVAGSPRSRAPPPPGAPRPAWHPGGPARVRRDRWWGRTSARRSDRGGWLGSWTRIVWWLGWRRAGNVQRRSFIAGEGLALEHAHRRRG